MGNSQGTSSSRLKRREMQCVASVIILVKAMPLRGASQPLQE